jgi:hypothetical protein
VRRRALIAAAILAAAAGPAVARQCLPADAMRAALSDRFGEQVVFEGLSRNALVTLWLGASGSWTVVVLTPEGVGCVLAAGEAGSLVPPAAVPQGEPG